MRQIAPEGPVYQAGTLSGNPLAMAAGLATLRRLRAKGVYEALEARTRQLTGGLAAVARDAGIELTTGALGGMFGFFFHPGPVRCFDDAKKSHIARFRAFFGAMLDAGVYLAPSAFEAGFVSTAHRSSDIDRTLEAARVALRIAARVR
jgi:glutamate-1-semialdehyde 2,1-aminomutase